MKDNWHTYLFWAILIYDNKSKLGSRLDYIRSNGRVTVAVGQNAKKGPTDLAKNFRKYLSC